MVTARAVYAFTMTYTDALHGPLRCWEQAFHGFRLWHELSPPGCHEALVSEILQRRNLVRVVLERSLVEW